MKKILVITLVFIASHNLFAQIEITPFGGWHWTGKIPAYRQDIKVTDKGNYGIRGGVTVRDQMVVEFEWNHTDNAAEYYRYDLGNGFPDYDELVSTNLNMNYYMLGFLYEATYDEPLIPYGLLNIGLLNVKAEITGDPSNNWFTVGLGGGIKYFLSDNVGIRLQARLLLPMQFAGIGFGCGIGSGGGGCGSSVNAYTNIIQGDFTGGIILKFGG